MKNEAHFTKKRRHDIAEKLTSACLNGKAVNEFSRDIDKLIKYTNLSYGDALAISKEVANLLQIQDTKLVVEKGVPPSNIGVTHPILHDNTFVEHVAEDDRRTSTSW